ncbi:MAG: hypothetical protein ABI658_03020 [Acidimicrobiales bacterium]
MSAIVVALSAAAFVVLLTLLVGRASGDEDAAPTFDAIVRKQPDPRPEEPASFKSARWLVVNAATAGGLHFRVRPALVELTDARLRANHGMDLKDPGAHAVVGDSLWAIVRPDARPPDDRMAIGLSPSMLRVLLDRLEML